MSELAALIFDVDGTLAETEELHRAAFNAAFAEAGLDWNWHQPLYRELLKVTGGKERMAHYLAEYRPDESDDMIARLAGLHRDKTAHYAQMIASGGIALRPGVARLITEAHEAGLRLAVATTTSADNVAALLTATLGAQAVDWFGVVGAGDVVPDKKPAPDIYLWVLERLGISADQAVAVEDSPNGLAAAVAAGIPTIVAPGVYTEPSDFAGAMAVVDDLGEVTLAEIEAWRGGTA